MGAVGNGEVAPDTEDRSVLTRVAPAPDSEIAYGPLPDQVADCFLSADLGLATARPLLLLMHGGYWRPRYDREHLRTFAAALAAAGWQVVSIEYRRIPGDPDAMVADVRAAIENLPDQIAGHNGEVIMIGHSAGGHLALWAAAQVALAEHSRTQITGVIALAPVSDLELAQQLDLNDGGVRAFLGCPAQERADLNPMYLAPLCPITCLHGNLDSLVPITLSRNYVAAHAGSTVNLVEIEGIAHFELIDPSSIAWPVVLDALRSIS